MTTVRVVEVLDYCDGPRTVLAEDDRGRVYLADFIAADGESERYQAVPAPVELLARLRAGDVDLLDFMLEAGAEEWYLTEPTRHVEPSLALIRQAAPIADSEWLPPVGCTFEDDGIDWEADVFQPPAQEAAGAVSVGAGRSGAASG